MIRLIFDPLSYICVKQMANQCPITLGPPALTIDIVHDPQAAQCEIYVLEGSKDTIVSTMLNNPELLAHAGITVSICGNNNKTCGPGWSVLIVSFGFAVHQSHVSC